MFVLLVTGRPAQFDDFRTALVDRGVDVGLTTTARAALVHAKIEPPTLAVVDEGLADASAFEVVAKLTQANATIRTAVASRLSPDAFHEAGHGLGILMALPPQPKAKDALALLQALAATA